jgi:hypothetical protein
MSKYAIASRNTQQVVLEYGTFATLAEARDFILYERMMDYNDFMQGKGLLYITDAAAGNFAKVDA